MDVGLSNIAIDVAIFIAAIAVIAVIVLVVRARSRPQVRRTLALAEVQQGLHRTGIVAVEGRERGAGLAIYVRNRSDALVTVHNERGTLLQASDPGWQNLVAARTQSFEVPPKTTQKFQVEALSLEAHKRPPGPRGEGGYQVGALGDNGDLFTLFDAIEGLEREVARHVQRVEGDRVEYRPMSDDLTILAATCTYARQDQGGYEARVSGLVVQYALWQLTDGVSLDDLADLCLPTYTEEGKARLVGQVLAANILLRAAGIEPATGI